MKSASGESLRDALAAHYGKRWTRLRPADQRLHTEALVPSSCYGRENLSQQFHLFEAWRPRARTVTRLFQTELCSQSFQTDQLTRFILAWSKPSGVHSYVLDPGERVYTFEPKATQAEWNERYMHWMTRQWRAFLQSVEKPHGADRIYLTEYGEMLGRATESANWLRQVSDFHFEAMPWRK